MLTRLFVPGSRGFSTACLPRLCLRTQRCIVFTALALTLIVFYSRAYTQQSKFKGDRPKTPTLGRQTPYDTTNISQKLVVASMSYMYTDWIHKDLPTLPVDIYHADTPTAPLSTPLNKGHESMVYLTHIITNYHTLPDITIFTHADRTAWHNEAMLHHNLATMLHRLNRTHILQQGYTNLRCAWEPGCPSWLDRAPPSAPFSPNDNPHLAHEQTTFKTTWPHLHPHTPGPPPAKLAQPCCSQFAATRAAIHAVPLDRWTHYRDWLLATNLSDYEAGSVWEYTWQVLLAGAAVVCPGMRGCYCDLYGICFRDEGRLQWYLEGEREVEGLKREVVRLRGLGKGGRAEEVERRWRGLRGELEGELGRAMGEVG